MSDGARSSEVDREVGRRIRTNRLAKGLSQTALGAAVNVSFQQVQKYESGTNRVSPGRLQGIADHLQVPVSTFYPSMDRASPSRDGEFYPLLQHAGAIALLRGFAVLKPSIQKTVVDLIEMLASERGYLAPKRRGRP